MNRGSRLPPKRNVAALTSFNEAPIHESGKWFAPASSLPDPSGFNEAPIHESGKCQDGHATARGGLMLQ